MGNIYEKTIVIIATMAISISLFGCEAENKTANTTNVKKEKKDTQTDSIVQQQIKEAEKRGNTVGNISNKGKMVESDGWIYYAVNGSKNTKGIYRTKDYFQTSELLVKDVNASYININNQSLYFIHMATNDNTGSNELPSLMKYDISAKKLDTLKTDTSYVYIKDQTLFYPKKYSEHGGFDIVGIIKMDLKTGQEEETTPKYTGWAQTIDDSILHWNKNRGRQVTKNNKTWSKEKYAEISSAVYHDEKLYAVVDFSLPFEAHKATHGIYELDVQQNTEKLLIQDVLQMNITGDTFYYVKNDGVYKRKINGGSEELIYNKALEPSKSYLYFIAGDMYLYTDNGVILNLKTKKSNEIKDKPLPNDAMLNKVLNAQKELTYIQTRAFTGNSKSMGRFSYGELLIPAYNTKKALETTLSTYFSKQFITEYMQSEYVKEIDGKMHYVIGDPSSKAATKYIKITSSQLKDGKLAAKVETYNEYANVTKDVEIEFSYENNQWVINKMPSFE
ncbi:DUF5050 domain-containing protein [Bacillus sp. BP-3]|uniref:DUF5050 domain-containing protein n=1 Tax=Bacillus sp. BP-3 TaxID=3022773 RepID=UPI00232DF979|nr:DUF5050 domain-containing protein [Bacillus sp. BP-3]MDC2867416.1 DUF5050 domain-containing protein [Bacillus sp. BP-3]